jgi:hypothetical protein
MRIDDNDVPHIQAQCSGCGFLFDMKYGTNCPACHHVGVKWARLVSQQEAQEYGSEARTRLRNALDSLGSASTMSLAERKSIDECEAIYALEDHR